MHQSWVGLVSYLWTGETTRANVMKSAGRIMFLPRLLSDVSMCNNDCHYGYILAHLLLSNSNTTIRLMCEFEKKQNRILCIVIGYMQPTFDWIRFRNISLCDSALSVRSSQPAVVICQLPRHSLTESYKLNDFNRMSTAFAHFNIRLKNSFWILVDIHTSNILQYSIFCVLV